MTKDQKSRLIFEAGIIGVKLTFKTKSVVRISGKLPRRKFNGKVHDLLMSFKVDYIDSNVYHRKIWIEYKIL